MSMESENVERLVLNETPDLSGGALLIGFSGWMNGADVSTGTVDYLVDRLDGRPIGSLNAEDFYVLNVPGSMEISAMFRPAVHIEEGLVHSLNMPSNTFYAIESAKLLVCRGIEPNVGWQAYATCMIEAARRCRIETIYFIGSVGSIVPHTREPVFWSTMTSEVLRDRLENYGITPTNYQGPGHFITYLSERAKAEGFDMATLVAGIPSYIEGRNPRCIEAMLVKLGEILDLEVDLGDLRAQRSEFLQGVTLAMQKNPKLQERIEQLEKVYDQELSGEASEDEDDGDTRDWFERQNIRLDS